MVILLLISILVIGGIFCLPAAKSNPRYPRWISLITLSIVSMVAGVDLFGKTRNPLNPEWILDYRCGWLNDWGISLHFGLDGMSLLLIVLTIFLGFMSVGISWNVPDKNRGFFHLNLLFILAGIIGVFTSLDLLLLYFFWELMLIPMYFLIVIWGHENRRYAALKFFIFTQASSLLMLISIIGLASVHRHTCGRFSFDYFDLLKLELPSHLDMLFMLGFFVAFAVKLPAFLLHTWLPDAHSEAPTAGSVILAGLLLKTGAYGLIRFAVPLFPASSSQLAPLMMIAGAAGIIYGAVLAFSQNDLKRMVAYTSISHLGFVLIGVYAWTELSLKGAVMQMICHGLSTGALFMIAGSLYERIHTRDVSRMSGLWSTAPRMGAAAMFFAMASLGLPGLGNFIAEFLILIGSFQAHKGATIAATIGIVFATVYSLILVQRVFLGSNQHNWSFKDLNPRESFMYVSMALTLIWLGCYPQPVFNILNPLVKHLTMSYQLISGGFIQ